MISCARWREACLRIAPTRFRSWPEYPPWKWVKRRAILRVYVIRPDLMPRTSWTEPEQRPEAVARRRWDHLGRYLER